MKQVIGLEALTQLKKEVEGKKSNYFILPSSWLRCLPIKDRLTREKKNVYLHVYLTYTWRLEQKLSNSVTGPSYHIKYFLQLKTKERKASCGKLPGKEQQTRVRFVMQILVSAFSTDKFLRIWSHPSNSWYREENTEIFFINEVTSLFLKLLLNLCCFFKIIGSK